MASTTTPATRESKKRLKAKPKTEHKSWQTRNAARNEKQAAYAAKRAAAEAVEQSSAISETPDAATVRTVRSPKPQSYQPWKAAANTRGFGDRTRTPRKAGEARKAGSA